MKFISRMVAMLDHVSQSEKNARWQPNEGSGSDWLMVMEKNKIPWCIIIHMDAYGCKCSVNMALCPRGHGTRLHSFLFKPPRKSKTKQRIVE